MSSAQSDRAAAPDSKRERRSLNSEMPSRSPVTNASEGLPVQTSSSDRLVRADTPAGPRSIEPAPTESLQLISIITPANRTPSPPPWSPITLPPSPTPTADGLPSPPAWSPITLPPSPDLAPRGLGAWSSSSPPAMHSKLAVADKEIKGAVPEGLNERTRGIWDQFDEREREAVLVLMALSRSGR